MRRPRDEAAQDLSTFHPSITFGGDSLKPAQAWKVVAHALNERLHCVRHLTRLEVTLSWAGGETAFRSGGAVSAVAVNAEMRCT